jgi:hypothetical protein
LFLAWAALAVLTSSCGKGGRKEVYPVRGQVFDGNGKPAVNALVIFHPADGDDKDTNKPRATVDEKGAFTLTTYENGDGAPEGEYVVTVEWRPRKKSPFDREGDDVFGGRYSNPKTSTLRARVQKEPTELKPFKLD